MQGDPDVAGHPQPVALHGPAADQRADLLDAQLEGTALDRRQHPEVGVQPAVRREVAGGTAAGLHGATAHQAGGVQAQAHVPQALLPLTALAQLRRVDGHFPAGPVVVVALLAGVGGRLGPLHVPGGQHHAPAGLVLAQLQDLDGRALRGQVDLVDPGVPGQHQFALGPADVLQRGAHAQVRVDAQGLARDVQLGVGQGREGGVLADQTADLDGLLAPLRGQQGDQLVELVLADQQPLHPQVRRQGHDDLGVDVVQEAVGRAQELVAVLLVAVGHHVEEQPEVVREHAGVVLLLEAREGLAALPAQEVADLQDRGDAVAHRARVGAALRDGGGGLALAQPPVVAGLGDHVDGVGEVVRPHGDGDVLVQAGLGEGEAVLLPERPAEHLVAGYSVRDELAVLGDVGALACLAREHPHQRDLPGLLAPEVEHVAGGEGGTGLVEAAHHQTVGVRRDEVVAVDERQELRLGGHVGDTGVAGGPQSSVLLAYQPEPRVTLRVGRGYRRRVVG